MFIRMRCDDSCLGECRCGDVAEGGRVSREMLLGHTDVPMLLAVRASREALEECGMSGRVSLVAASGIRTGVDAAKCLALGAGGMMIGTVALMTLGCNSPRYFDDYTVLGTAPGKCHHCHTDLCLVGSPRRNQGWRSG